MIEATLKKIIHHLFLKKSTFIFCISILLLSCKHQAPSYSSATTTTSDVWDLAREIEESMVVPTFPKRTFNILEYGAVKKGEVLNTAAFSEAIKACSEEVLFQRSTMLPGLSPHQAIWLGHPL